MKNSEILHNIIMDLEKKHINLYHSISKEELHDYISSINNIDDLNNIEFDYVLLSVFALFKEMHTSYCFNKNEYLDHKLIYLNKQIYIKDNNKYYKVKTINNYNHEFILNRLEKIISRETEEFFSKMMNIYLNNGYIYKVIGLCNSDYILIETDNGQSIEVKHVTIDDIVKKNGPIVFLNYSYKLLDDIIHIKYKKCMDMKDYPFVNFVEDIKKEIKLHNISKYILDLRNNVGGSSYVIKPLVELVKEQKLNGVVLIDNGVCSSGLFAVVDFIKNFNALTIGEATGSSVKEYGCYETGNVEGFKYTYSTKFFDFSNMFGFSGSIKPDIEVKQSIEDIENKYDRVLEVGIDRVKNLKTKKGT